MVLLVETGDVAFCAAGMIMLVAFLTTDAKDDTTEEADKTIGDDNGDEVEDDEDDEAEDDEYSGPEIRLSNNLSITGLGVMVGVADVVTFWPMVGLRASRVGVGLMVASGSTTCSVGVIGKSAVLFSGGSVVFDND